MPPGNPLVTTGWTLTRNLVNMFFIIILAFIGLATALQIERYKYEKILPNLILIALIINFSPVICGIFIDASNIVMNFFVGSFSGFEGAVNDLTEQQTLVTTGLANQDITVAIQRALQLFVLVGFNFYLSLVLAVFSIIFMFRYIFIWLHVILSPIAFFSYIVPGFSGYWTKWWRGFLQWCFVGVVAAFFLYLGNQIFMQSSTIMQSSAVQAGNLSDQSFWLDTIQTLLPLGFAVGFITAGMGAAMSTSVAGASYAIRTARWAGATIVAGAGLASKGVGTLKERAVDRFASSKTARDFSQGFARGKLKEAGADASRSEKFGRFVTGNLPGWAKRRMSGAMLERTAHAGDRIKERETEFTQRFGKDFHSAAAYADNISGLDWTGKIAMANYLKNTPQGIGLTKSSSGFKKSFIKEMDTHASYMIPDFAGFLPELVGQKEEIKENDISRVMKAKGLTREKAVKALGETAAYTETASIIQKNLAGKEDVEKLTKLGFEGAEATIRAAYKKATKLMTMANIEAMPDKALNDPMLLQAIALHGSAQQVKKIFEEKSEVSENLIKAFEGLGGAKINESNPTMARYIVSDAVISPIMEGRVEGLEGKNEHRLLKMDGKQFQNEEKDITLKLETAKQERDRLKKESAAGGPNVTSDSFRTRMEKAEKEYETAEKNSKNFEKMKEYRSQSGISNTPPSSAETDETTDKKVKIGYVPLHKKHLPLARRVFKMKDGEIASKKDEYSKKLTGLQKQLKDAEKEEREGLVRKSKEEIYNLEKEIETFDRAVGYRQSRKLFKRERGGSGTPSTPSGTSTPSSADTIAGLAVGAASTLTRSASRRRPGPPASGSTPPPFSPPPGPTPLPPDDPEFSAFVSENERLMETLSPLDDTEIETRRQNLTTMAQRAETTLQEFQATASKMGKKEMRNLRFKEEIKKREAKTNERKEAIERFEKAVTYRDRYRQTGGGATSS